MSRKQKKNLIRIIFSLVLFIILFIVDKSISLDKLIGGNFGFLLPLSLYLVIYLLIGYDVLRKAFLNIIHGHIFDENFLMCLATLGAFGLGIFKAIQKEEIEGFDEACAVLIFYQVGEWFQSYAVGKSRKSITSLMDIRADYANLKNEDGKYIIVDPTEVNVDDVIMVKPGEKVPLDGIVVSGSSTLDTKALTGESLPREIYSGCEIISGTINLSSPIEIKVTKVFYDSTVSKILDLVENASNHKAKSENFISKFAKYYTPIVVIIAVMLAIIPSIITKDFTTWLYRALSFLVVSCPCALVISIPLSFFAGIGCASKHGILVKGSAYLERFNKSNIFVFDKTGTLTKGNFAVVEVFPKENESEVLRLALIAEKNSNHPIANSIREICNAEIDNNYTITEIAGKGIKACGNTTILCGNEKLMNDYNIEIIKPSSNGTIIYIAEDSIFKGYIVIEDEIKDEAYEAVSYLNSICKNTIMLTGDNPQIANEVAKKIGITEYKASLLPQNKVYEIQKILDSKDKNDVLCFVGDGVNDAPVLMESDIGISMGSIGSDAAIEASDIVLMYDDLKSLINAKKIAKKTMSIVYQNIYFAIIIKVLILILSSLGLANMWIAVFGDVGVAFLCILNAIRVNTKIK